MPSILERLTTALADRYRIERELGQGGMATVYLAEDVRHKRKVALKVLKPELAAVLGAERFVQEITTTAALQHPHILPLFDSGTADGFLYYVMPFIQGETLRDKLNRETQLGVDEAVKIATDVAEALHYAHTQGVIHRDIKPENILIQNGRPMVADFGIALALSAAAGGRMTETGLSLGTPHYMSPEQATAEKEISARSDVYSLASVLYEMLTGQPPHVGGSAQQIIMRIVTDTARPVTELRKTVSPNVAAAVAKALEKLPADRFATAKDFAEALGNPGFTSARMTADARLAPAGRAWIRDPRTIGVMLAALGSLIALGWMITRPALDTGPREYDVALPDSAPADMKFKANFVVAPRGDFVIYERGGGSEPELWYRSLFDGTVRRIGATERAYHPTISPDGIRFAFIRLGSAESTVEVMSVAGGGPTVIAQSRSPNSIEWLADGRILLTEGDGLRARLLDPDGGPATDTRIQYCINPTLLPDGALLLCGGGGEKRARWVNLGDSTSEGRFRTIGPDSSVFGADFRVFDEKYLVWVSNDGDLLAAPVELAARRIGRSVRLVTGLGRDPYSGAGSYAVSATGTLVYANGINGVVGHLVRADERTSDTLPVGREAFLQFAMSPNGRRLASVVERTNGEELRLYDLRSGEHIVWMRRARLRQPVWSASGDRLATATVDSVFAGPPDAASPPQLLFRSPMSFEAFAWMPDGRLVGTAWNSNLVVSAHLDRQPPSFDTLATFAALGRLSPGGRWMAYNSADFRATWVEPVPRTGQRFAAGTGSYPQWLSASEFVVSTDSGRFERISIDGSVQPPTVSRRHWFAVPRFVGIASGGFSLTRDGRVIYKQGGEIEPARYLRVVPHWVDRMKRAVDEANR